MLLKMGTTEKRSKKKKKQIIITLVCRLQPLSQLDGPSVLVHDKLITPSLSDSSFPFFSLPLACQEEVRTVCWNPLKISLCILNACLPVANITQKTERLHNAVFFFFVCFPADAFCCERSLFTFSQSLSVLIEFVLLIPAWFNLSVNEIWCFAFQSQIFNKLNSYGVRVVYWKGA